MSEDADRGRNGGGRAEPDEDDADETAAVVRTVGRLVKLWRERASMTQAELGAAIGYCVDLVASVERGRRVPRPEFLSAADEVLGAGGILAAMAKDVAEARYPKKVRDLAKLEAEAVELGAYANHNMHGLLQTEEYARALFSMRKPAYGDDEVERHVAARMARQAILGGPTAPMLTFVQEEVTLHRPIGGRAVLRRQLQRLLELGQLRNVSIQVMPTARDDHAGMGGPVQLLKLKDGAAVGHTEVQLTNRLISDPKEVQILEMRYGIIRAQALTPSESLALVAEALGET
ncbi:helix-turn-helix transcriptional regulator [Streptomyces sp. WMMB 322]|uniref:helix-turn-helix domain-containing protein n=1 Tax=Streptomyces sp. WMMB 322 TaxID=1286821 RepID=UPI0006E247A5|nr:helix-turn-helix transcriptional regulator [Streptomyces sp. WMMB 322]SCK51663.1 Helix-turn-helix domain-containing protein [Streptomyces sp. WMMB 322]